MEIAEGWKLVPVEPAPEMIEAAKDNRSSQPEGTLPGSAMRQMFGAMLAAAPTPPAIGSCVEPYKSHQCLDCGKVIGPTPPAQSIRLKGYLGYCNDFYSIEYVEQELSDKDKKVLTPVYITDTTPPAREEEPVAEVVKFGDGPWGEIYKTYVNLPSGTKLYTRPADDNRKGALVGASDGCETRVARYYTAEDDKLRKAAEEAEKLLLQLRNRHLLGANDFAVLWNLCAALEGK